MEDRGSPLDVPEGVPGFKVGLLEVFVRCSDVEEARRYGEAVLAEGLLLRYEDGRFNLLYSYSGITGVKDVTDTVVRECLEESGYVLMPGEVAFEMLGLWRQMVEQAPGEPRTLYLVVEGNPFLDPRMRPGVIVFDMVDVGPVRVYRWYDFEARKILVAGRALRLARDEEMCYYLPDLKARVRCVEPLVRPVLEEMKRSPRKYARDAGLDPNDVRYAAMLALKTFTRQGDRGDGDSHEQE